MLAQLQTGAAEAGSSTNPLVELWLLRILVTLDFQKSFVRSHGFGNEAVAQALGLWHLVDPLDEGIDTAAAFKALRRRHRAAEREAAIRQAPPVLRGNLARLAALVGLSASEGRVLEFVVLSHSDPLLKQATDDILDISDIKAVRLLTVILQLPEPAVRNALHPAGLLHRSGLLLMRRLCVDSLRDSFELLSDRFADQMTAEEIDPLSLLRHSVTPVAPATLGLADYGHVDASLRIARPYLRQALATQRAGVNVYVYGAPGTGKTQLARVLAQDLGCQLYEVASADENGELLESRERLKAFRAAQCFFGQRRALILFDEAEDVFSGSHPFAALFGPHSPHGQNKAGLNRMLEDNPVPTLWMSNIGSGLDAAHIRRFDLIFELPVPPRAQRRRITEQACQGLADARSVARLAEIDTLAPAVIARAAAVLQLVGSELPAGSHASALEHLIDNTLRAQGHAGLPPRGAAHPLAGYDPAFTHADTDLARLADGLKLAGAGRLCLYGPPGTGKTAFGRWLAEQLGKPLQVKRASDLMGPYLGESERNIASAFREAAQAGAVLLIDEVDSFLQDRQGAQRSWEVAMVNEMLTQMETFEGLFIASTNLMDRLDSAVLRRFDLKLKFGYLRAEQAGALLARHCSALGLPAPDEASLTALKRLPQLTPGDFAGVARQHRFHPLTTAARWVETLARECALKAPARPTIGFLP